MGYSVLISIFIGVLFAFCINYFSDLLPFTFTLSRPICHQEGCNRQFSWIEYLLLRRCDNCRTRSRLRPVFVYVLTLAASLYLWITQISFLTFLISIFVISYLFIVGIIDFEHHLILLPLNITGLVILGSAGILLHGWMSTLIGGVAGAAIMYLLFLFGKLFTRLKARKLNVSISSLEDSLAFGDVILVTLLGLFLGWPLTWFGLLLGLLFAGIFSSVIMVILFLGKKYRQQALSVFIPLGPGFIISAITLNYFPKFITSFWL